MSETLNPIVENMARQIAEAVMEYIRTGPRVDTPWMNEVQAGAYLQLLPRGMQNHRRQGTGPKWCKRGVVRYHRDDLDDYMRSGEVEPRSTS